MAFHVACPITCRRICYCTLGFPHSLRSEKGKETFAEEVARVEEFLKDPWRLRVKDGETVQVKVPKVVVVTQPPLAPAAPLTTNYQPQLQQQQQRKEFSIAAVTVPLEDGGGGGGIVDSDEAAFENASAQTKRIALQKKAAAASIEAEDFARRFEAGDLMGTAKDVEEQGQSNVKIMCRLCFSGENEGTERARKMLPCKSCGKKYHRNCLKAWSQNRDLFHWSSWTCPSCRICEICRRTGDPNKFMFCRRCDAAYHCYCQHPPHKNVSSGPYLCPKHTRCHSCGSSVPGNGLSVRWFLGYTCCDACGRLFVKGNYCPVCLKVYRDSESTPMVCCDICQRWVHCQCDGISDERYLQFQVDGNLQYVCPTCRGECYQVRNPEEAVQELWRRRDEADRDLIASLRAAAGLPTQEEIFSISPFSDDEDNGPSTLKNEYGRSLKFSLKGLVDKSPKKSKEYGKKSSNKKYGKKKSYQGSVPGKTEEPQNFEGHNGLPSFGYSAGDKNEELQTYRSSEPDTVSSPAPGSLNEGICSTNQAGVLKHKFIDDVKAGHGTRTSRTVQIKSSASHGSNSVVDIGNHAGMSKPAKGTKLVIHLGSRNKSLTSPPRSDASSCQREPDMTTSNGSEDVVQIVDEHGESHVTASMFVDGKGDKIDYTDQIKGSKSKGKEGPLIKIRKHNSEVTDKNSKFADGFGTVAAPNTRSVLGKRTADGSTAAVRSESEVPASIGNKVSSMKYAEGQPDTSGVSDDDNSRAPSVSNSLMKDSRPLLKLKFKKPQENQSLWMTAKDEEMSLPKGQRSKRKRPSPSRDKASTKGDDHTSHWYQDSAMDEIMDANWILQKLGKDAVGKRVEVHQSSDNSWHRGTVVEVFEGTSIVSVALDDGKAMNLELGKQGVRFVSQKQKR